MTRNFTLGLLLTLAGTIVASAQDRPESSKATTTTAVTVSVSADGVRFAALGSVKQMRLEVFGADGAPLYSSDFRPGNVRDWKLEDAHGLRIPDGTYLCVVTFRDVSGRLGVKQGAVLVQGGQAALKLAGGDEPGAVEAEKGLDPVTDNGAVTLTSHDGSAGQLVSTRGGLSFRAGDFFAGRDRELMRLTPDGNLGLGVAAPKARLDVAGTIRARGGIQFEDGSVLTSARGAASNPGRFSANAPAADGQTAAAIGGSGTTNRLAKWLDGAGNLGDSSLAESGGNVGIGTTTPAAKLQVAGGDMALDNNRYLVTRRTTGELHQVFSLDNNNDIVINRGAGFYGGQYSADVIAVLGTGNAFEVVDGTAQVNRLFRVLSNGNVGVGTVNPQSKLEVAGDLKVTGSAVVDGNIAAKYQDVAEWVQAREPLDAGTVVILDTTQANTVRSSTRPYDTNVAGIVSAQPGVILGQAGEGKVMVATTGRVKVRVDATRRPIRIGDLLVTSGKSGAAMRSLPVRAGRARLHRPGTIIGKALEPLANGTGEILVLLSLQ